MKSTIPLFFFEAFLILKIFIGLVVKFDGDYAFHVVCKLKNIAITVCDVDLNERIKNQIRNLLSLKKRVVFLMKYPKD